MNSKGKIPIANYFFCVVGSSQKLYIDVLSSPNCSDTKLYSSGFHSEVNFQNFFFHEAATQDFGFTCIKNRTLMSMKIVWTEDCEIWNENAQRIWLQTKLYFSKQHTSFKQTNVNRYKIKSVTNLCIRKVSLRSLILITLWVDCRCVCIRKSSCV
jgi:hypothetical protein